MNEAVLLLLLLLLLSLFISIRRFQLVINSPSQAVSKGIRFRAEYRKEKEKEGGERPFFVSFDTHFPSIPSACDAPRYTTGAMATMGACLFTNPLEVLKTRMQLQVRERGTKLHMMMILSFGGPLSLPLSFLSLSPLHTHRQTQTDRETILRFPYSCLFPSL